MRQKSDPTLVAAEKLVRDIAGRRGSNIQPKRRSASCSTACPAKVQSLSFAGERTSPRARIIPGRRIDEDPWRMRASATPGKLVKE